MSKKKKFILGCVVWSFNILLFIYVLKQIDAPIKQINECYGCFLIAFVL